MPDTQYAERGTSFIAYQVMGEGPPDIVFMRSAMNHIELQWEQPRFARFLTRLASFGRLIVFDPRGSGLSDAFVEGGIPTVEDWADDALSVMDAVGAERAAIVCSGGGTTRAIPLVAFHPERVSFFVVCDGYARRMYADDYQFGFDVTTHRERTKLSIEHWGRSVPGQFRPEERPLETWTSRYRRYSASRGFARQMMELVETADSRELLPAIRVPTLIVHHAENSSGLTPEFGRYLASRIEGASYVELPGRTLVDWCFPDPDAVAAEIEKFLLGSHTPPEPDRVLATVLFTDIVASTRSTAEAGDKRWRDTMDTLDRIVTEEVGRFRGRVVKSTGDGHLATFDGPGRAIRCAKTMCERVGSLGLQIRSGLHTGEIELRGDDIGGIAVSIARRVCDSAADGCVYVSSSVPPLVAGSKIEFTDRGTHQLKGVPGAWQLYEVTVSSRD